MRVKRNINKGFTLIELLVSLSLFSVTMLVATGALLSLVDANAKSQSNQSIMNNLNIAIDGMMRSIRMGYDYSCGTNRLINKNNCTTTPSSQIAYRTYDGKFQSYYLQNKRIYRIQCEGENYNSSRCSDLPITSPDIEINGFDIMVHGVSRSLSEGNYIQPVAVFIINGVSATQNVSSAIYGTKPKNQIKFIVQTVATQRVLDL